MIQATLTLGTTAAAVIAISASGAVVDVTPCVNGSAAGYPCEKVDLLAHMPLATIGGGNGSDIWGWTDIGSSRDFAIVARSTGTSFIEITDPCNPVYLGDLPSHTGTSSWRDVRTCFNHAFIVSDGNGAHGMQVFNLAQLLSVASPPVTFAETAHFNGINSAHNIAINEETGYAYIVGSNECSGGLYIVDLSIPAVPVFAGCFSADGYTADAQVVVYEGADSAYAGGEIAFCCNADTLTIVDVTNKASPTQISRTPYAGAEYTNQGWLTDDHRYFLLSDELDELNNGHNTRTHLWDVADLDNPTYLGFYEAENASIDHQLLIRDRFAFLTSYRGGLRILDTTDVASGALSEAAFFDVYPTDDNPSFSGAWGAYPFFDSDVVIVSSIQDGLFVVGPRLCPADLDFNGSVDVFDLLAVLGAWSTPGADVDGDGDTNVTDLLAVLSSWGACP